MAMEERGGGGDRAGVPVVPPTASPSPAPAPAAGSGAPDAALANYRWLLDRLQQKGYLQYGGHVPDLAAAALNAGFRAGHVVALFDDYVASNGGSAEAAFGPGQHNAEDNIGAFIRWKVGAMRPGAQPTWKPSDPSLAGLGPQAAPGMFGAGLSSQTAWQMAHEARQGLPMGSLAGQAGQPGPNAGSGGTPAVTPGGANASPVGSTPGGTVLPQGGGGPQVSPVGPSTRTDPAPGAGGAGPVGGGPTVGPPTPGPRSPQGGGGGAPDWLEAFLDRLLGRYFPQGQQLTGYGQYGGGFGGGGMWNQPAGGWPMGGPMYFDPRTADPRLFGAVGEYEATPPPRGVRGGIWTGWMPQGGGRRDDRINAGPGAGGGRWVPDGPNPFPGANQTTNFTPQTGARPYGAAGQSMASTSAMRRPWEPPAGAQTKPAVRPVKGYGDYGEKPFDPDTLDPSRKYRIPNGGFGPREMGPEGP